MALNPEKVSFLLNQIAHAEYRTFKSTVTQFFHYLTSEVKDNPVYDGYEADIIKWKDWPIGQQSSFGMQWSLPDTIEEAKSLSYDIYKCVAVKDGNWADNFAFSLFRQSSLTDNVGKLNSTFIGYFEQVIKDILNANPEIEEFSPKKIKNQTVFIVHGHDNELKTELQLLLSRAGVNSIVLHEQADKGRTIIDKLVQETEIAGYAIALLTPDDLTLDGNNRARQNVILELGYFLGKLGKERLRMIVKGQIEIPSDLQGILYEKHDNNGAWKIKLLKELQAVGIYVDLESAVKSF